jgi:hypothetical protein
MSTPDVERAPERPLSVLVKSTGLLLVLGAAAWILLRVFAAPVDGAAKQREYFGAGALPFGLELAGATRLATGDTLVRFRRAEGTRGPLEVVFVQYRSAAAVEGLFRPTVVEGGGPPGSPGGLGARLKEWEREHAFAWHATMKRAEIAWGSWSSKLLVERAFQQGGGWREEARVDLSRPERPLVLFAHWPDDEPVDEGLLQELLEATAAARPAAEAGEG